MKTKSIKKILLVGFILTGLALGGSYVGYHKYVAVRQAHLIKQAEQYLAKSDQRRASLCLQRVLHADPKNIAACRLMAELTEAARSPGTLLWRSRVVELNPAAVADRLALVQSALMFRDYTLATNALAGVAAAERHTAAYQTKAGEVAATIGQFAQAETHFQTAAQLEPTNPVPQLNLAVVRLHGTNAANRTAARATLTHLAATSPPLRCQALRELVVDALRSAQTNTALALSEDLVQQTNSSFSDRLLRLEVLKRSPAAGFQPTLAAFQQEAGTNMARIYELSVWLMTRIGPGETLTWLQHLPPLTQTNQPVALLIAECQTMLGDWPNLQNSLAPQNWVELEFIRHAFLTRALRGQDLPAAAKAEWGLAMQTAEVQPGSLTMLLRLAAAWNWQREQEELLWAIVNQNPDEKWAVQALAQALYAGGRTRPLMQLCMQQVKRSPNEVAMKNNLAMTALLLDAQELNPHQLAREVYQMSPSNVACVSTLAFSLHLQKQDAEALKIIERLSPQELQDPAVAGYYGLILKATGHAAKAHDFLQIAAKAAVLPEEQKLFHQQKAAAPALNML